MAEFQSGRQRGTHRAPQARLEWGVYALLLGFVPQLIFAMQFGRRTFQSVLAVAALSAGASFATGFLLGFLFGIPRTVDSVGHEHTPGGRGQQAVARDPGAALPIYLANTNLGQVSDWLTKILVGVGLTQMTQIGRQTQTLLDYLAPGLGNAASSRSFALALVLYYLGGGFLLGYLWTSIRLPSVLRSRDILDLKLETQELGHDVGVLPKGTVAGFGGDTEQGLTEPELTDPAAKAQVANIAQRVKSLEKAGGGLDGADQYLRLARQLKRAGQFEEAERAYLRASELNPTDPAPLNFAGVLRSKYLGDYATAADYYRRAMDINPDYLSAVYNAACNEVRRGNRAEGLRLLRIAIEGNDRYRKLARRDAESGGPFESIADDPEFKALVMPEGEEVA